MSVAPKMMDCRVNTTYFVKNHEFFKNILKKMKNRYPGNMSFYCTCEYCISYFFGDFENST